MGNNYLQTPILNCNIFGYGKHELKSKGEIELRIGCNLSNAQYPNLKSGYKIALKKYHKEGEKTVTLENFVLTAT